MLSDEEKKAVDKIKTLIQYLNVWKENFTIVPKDVKYLVTILNLIEKQSKEIEELKEKNKNLNWYFKNQKDNFVHKDKIKAKIEELEKEKNIPQEMDFKAFYRIEDLKNIEIAVLQSLLEKE